MKPAINGPIPVPQIDPTPNKFIGVPRSLFSKISEMVPPTIVAPTDALIPERNRAINIVWIF
jgi:hypothetical protein